jgi:hypothetical protein
MMGEILHINLTPFKSLKSNVLVGRISGEYARTILALDDVDRWIMNSTDLKVEFQLPDEVYVVNDSFLKGLLQKTYNKLGHDLFVSRVRFFTNNEALKPELQDDIDDFIEVLKALKG